MALRVEGVAPNAAAVEDVNLVGEQRPDPDSIVHAPKNAVRGAGGAVLARWLHMGRLFGEVQVATEVEADAYEATIGCGPL
jgi:hypothetical protein